MNDTRLQPASGDYIKCDCHNKDCHAGIQVCNTGVMVEVIVHGMDSSNEISVLLDLNHALDIAMILQEAASNAARG